MKLVNPLAVKGRVNIIKGRMKQRIAQLTGDESKFVEGKKDELVGRIQQRAVQAKKDIERAITHCWGDNR